MFFSKENVQMKETKVLRERTVIVVLVFITSPFVSSATLTNISPQLIFGKEKS